MTGYPDPPTEAEQEAVRARLAEQARRRPYDAADDAPNSAAALAEFIAEHQVWAGTGVPTVTVRAFAREVAQWFRHGQPGCRRRGCCP